MRVPNGVLFFAPLSAALLTALGLFAAAGAQADTAPDFAAPIAASFAQAAQPAQSCIGASRAAPAALRFASGTTFLLTDAGLVVLSQPVSESPPQADWPNTGN